MLLRCITEHVKTQNWTAVGLNFVHVIRPVIFLCPPGHHFVTLRR